VPTITTRSRAYSSYVRGRWRASALVNVRFRDRPVPNSDARPCLLTITRFEPLRAPITHLIPEPIEAEFVTRGVPYKWTFARNRTTLLRTFGEPGSARVAMILDRRSPEHGRQLYWLQQPESLIKTA